MRNWFIGICHHCVWRSLWTITTMDTLTVHVGLSTCLLSRRTFSEMAQQIISYSFDFLHKNNQNYLTWLYCIVYKTTILELLAMFGPGVELVSKELNHLAAILHVYADTFTLLIIFIVKRLQKEQNSTNLLLWPPICQNKSAITPKWINS